MVYKLHYFDTKGRAEGIRLLLTYVGADFEDVRIAMADWPARKTHFTYGQTPCLEVDGKQLCQTATIFRFLGRKHGLVPACEWAAAKVDELAASTDDVTNGLPALFALREDKEKLKAAYTDKMDNVVHPRLKIYDDYLGSQTSGFLSEKICWADFGFWNFMAMLIFFMEPDLSAYPHIQAFMAKIEALPKVAAWVAANKDVAFTPMMKHGMKALIQ